MNEPQDESTFFGTAVTAGGDAPSQESSRTPDFIGRYKIVRWVSVSG